MSRKPHWSKEKYLQRLRRHGTPTREHRLRGMIETLSTLRSQSARNKRAVEIYALRDLMAASNPGSLTWEMRVEIQQAVAEFAPSKFRRG